MDRPEEDHEAMKLYDNAFSPFARKVRMVLEFKGLPFETVDGLRPDARAALAAVNPRVEVPVLEDAGTVVVNSADIVAYLEQKHPTPPVFPAAPAARAQARAWERLADTLLDAIVHDISIWKWPILKRQDAPPPGLLEHAARDLGEIYGSLDADLGGGPFVCGDLSIADIALFPHLAAVKFLDVPFSAERHPNLFGWYRRLRALPLFAADLERTRTWLMQSAAAEGAATAAPPPVVWRGDRIEWLFAHGYHDWFVEEIRAGRVGWPKR
jgi:glutathione S-transferase